MVKWKDIYKDADGWSGNGGYYDTVGYRLLSWYNNPEKVEYLFNLGQLGNIGKPGSENGGETAVTINRNTARIGGISIAPIQEMVVCRRNSL